MDDLLTLHADRVTASNATHRDAASAARGRADEALREQIAAFGRKLAEACGIVSDACQALLKSNETIAGDFAAESGEAFAANLAEIAASGAAMEAEMRQRAAFLMTGKLPVEDELPKTETLELAAPLAEAAE